VSAFDAVTILWINQPPSGPTQRFPQPRYRPRPAPRTPKFSLSCPIGHQVDISLEKWTSNLRSHKCKYLPCHVGESRQVQLMRDGDGLGRAVAVLGENEIGFSPAWIVAFERVRPVQQNHNVSILF
jgi:hypothetical protein